jgi:hypothetical protein
MQKKLTPQDLMTLETYARERPAFRSKVIAHKKTRTVGVGPNSTWLFEEQEMLRTERIFEPEGIADELQAYNPLIPDGRNWKVTLLIEFADPATRPAELAKLIGIEDRCYVQVADFDRVFAIADEDLERENDTKTSSVHFLRFELSDAMVAALRGGSRLVVGIDHPNHTQSNDSIADETRKALIADFA